MVIVKIKITTILLTMVYVGDNTDAVFGSKGWRVCAVWRSLARTLSTKSGPEASLGLGLWPMLASTSSSSTQRLFFHYFPWFMYVIDSHCWIPPRHYYSQGIISQGLDGSTAISDAALYRLIINHLFHFWDDDFNNCIALLGGLV